MILAHIFGMRGHFVNGGFLFLLIALALVVVIVTWPSKSEPK